jgi:hypothetical protein
VLGSRQNAVVSDVDDYSFREGLAHLASIPAGCGEQKRPFGI